MEEKYLVVNAGSSSLKFSLYAVVETNGVLSEKEIVNGIVEKIGQEDSSYTLKFDGKKMKQARRVTNHDEAVETMLGALLENGFISDISEIKGVGHRVLHGGEIYSDSVLIDDKVLEDIVELTKYGPIHHPGQIAGIRGVQKVLPNVPQAAVFDTSFHQTIPKRNFMYAIPYLLYKEYGIRKYGFHGTSYKYITQLMQRELGKQDVNLIVCHIGSGASMCCIKNGVSYDTTMGLTPLAGLVMGTRCGSIDPSIIEYLCKVHGLSVSEVNDILNKESGLLGICGKSDWRDVCNLAKNGDENAILAMNMLQDSIVKYLVDYYTELDGNVDGIVFTAGIGENSSILRANVVNKAACVIGSSIDDTENDAIAGFKEKHAGIISTGDSRTRVYVIPTNEEAMILQDTYRICKNMASSKTYHKQGDIQ